MGEPSEITLESLRAEGAHRHDPARFHYLEVLARRLPGQPVAVQQVLAGRLHAAVAVYAERARSAAGVAGHSQGPAAPLASSALAQLNRDLSAQAQTQVDMARARHGASLSDLKSVRQFSAVWAQISAEQQLAQALHRGPENAGPLNSHKLMLRSLSLMQTLSPDYLRRFLSQVDSLLWLEQASAKPSSSTAKPGRKGRSRS
ncbi:MAG: DUF2894 domain-containing protein [Comamonadaceae bacterium]|jgi:hypothetical protein|nr:DUF2894 domain-containing protein [Comamonadaceae bacterium]